MIPNLITHKSPFKTISLPVTNVDSSENQNEDSPLYTIAKKKSKKKKKSKNKFSKATLDIIRTTMRNNMELTSIADNKANVLLSLNAIMISFLVPFTLRYYEEFMDYYLIFPLGLLIITCITTVSLAAKVLKPSKFDSNQKELKKGKLISPFFYGNYYNMGKEDFREYVDAAIADKQLIRNHLSDDLYYIGKRLGKKLMLMRIAFDVFMTGIFISMILATGLIIAFG